MNRRNKNSGFAIVEIIIVVVVLALLGGAGYFVFTKQKSKGSQTTQNSTTTTGEASDLPLATSKDEPPLKLKSIGINLDYYNPSTGKAGDITFTKMKLQFDRVFMGYGFVIPANSSASGNDKANPQPTIILPLGTKVRSLVDGVVLDIPKLYSNDYSVMVGLESDGRWRYETEHVINPIVKVGDKVKAGQVVAEVSDYDTKNHPGYGLYEIGILKGGGSGPPQHLCPFNYLDESIKEDTFKKLKDFYKQWETYRGLSGLYSQDEPVTGCVTLDPIDG